MPDIKIEYDGDYPNLCSGHLIITIDGIVWDFGKYNLTSGGTVWFDDNWTEHVTSGLWSVYEWPDGFPANLVDDVLDAINDEISLGCCGGCI
jgi:hypothetical protein